MKSLILFLTVLSTTGAMVYGQSYTEGADLPNTGPGPSYTVAGPNIIIAGTLTTPGDGQDYFQVVVPAGCSITGVDYTITDPATVGVNGFFHFNSNNDESYSGPTSSSFAFATQFPNTPFPVGPGTYDCYVIANIAFNCAWTMTFNTTCTACNEPDVPTITADTSICLGSSIDLDVLSGNLNDATDWEWYTGGCGGTSEGNGTTINVSPTVTTTYYTRGEGGCTTPAACDSVVVTVNTVDISVTQALATLTSGATSAIYQWLDCNNSYMAISGETNQDFTATSNGDYAVEVTQNGCVDTSACTNISGLGIIENSGFDNLYVYPNPAQNEVYVQLPNANVILIQLYDLQGNLIFNQTVLMDEGQTAVPLNDLSKGVYVLQISNGTLVESLKIIKN